MYIRFTNLFICFPYHVIFFKILSKPTYFYNWLRIMFILYFVKIETIVGLFKSDLITTCYLKKLWKGSLKKKKKEKIANKLYPCHYTFINFNILKYGLAKYTPNRMSRFCLINVLDLSDSTNEESVEHFFSFFCSSFFNKIIIIIIIN